MKVINATKARNDIFKLINEVNQFSEPVLINGKKGNVVMIGQDDWDGLQETLFLMSNLRLKDKLVKGIHTSNEKCVGEEVVGWHIV